MAECARCADGYARKDSTHDKGCPRRWLTVGEYFDELSYDEKWEHYALYRAAGITKARTIQEYSDGLYRPARKRKNRKMNLDPQTATVQDAKNFLKDNLIKGAKCPCCSQKVKVSKETVSDKQAAQLILLFKTFPVATVVDVNYFLQQVQPPEFGADLAKGRKWHKLKYWGLLEEITDKELVKKFRAVYPDSKGKRVALHKLTERGASFIQGNPIVKTIYVYDDVVHGWDEKATTTLQEALNGKYDVNALWQTAVPAVGHIA